MARDNEDITSVETQNQEDSGLTRKLITVSSIAAGVQFGWALQLSLLTPYVQLLGVPHVWSSFIWLCGPVSGMVVQPVVGYFSDASTSKYGRRRPIILSGALLVILAVVFIGFAADLGHMAGDALDAKVKSYAVFFFVLGFWVLDVANNMLQGPCRAFLADLCNGDPRKAKAANAYYSFFMALGNVLGYAAGAYRDLYKIFPFSKTIACDVYCANLKSCFFISIALLFTVTLLAVFTVPEKVHKKKETEGESVAFFASLFGALKDLPKPMWILMAVTALNWVAWFPFLLFDTDWMGKEIYGGEVGVGTAYDNGIHAGSLGLMINSIVLAFASLGVDSLSNGANGVKRLWGGVNMILAIGLGMTVVVTKYAEQTRTFYPDGSPMPPSDSVKASALAVFGVLGIPLSITFSLPFALATMYSMSTGAGQGLSLGLLNLAIVLPQMFVSIVAGPWDALFGGGNLPAFVAAAVAAVLSGLLAIFVLPTPSSTITKTPSMLAGGGH